MFEEKLKHITKWFKDSGLKINEEKTELCLFHRNDHAPITISLNGVTLKSKPSINVLGVKFDCKLSWNDQINMTINKAKKNLHAINLIKKHFNATELKQLLTSNYYSVLYYNSEIWHLPTLSPHLKLKLLSASANAIKLCITSLPPHTSHDTIHNWQKEELQPKCLCTNMHSNCSNFSTQPTSQTIGYL